MRKSVCVLRACVCRERGCVYALARATTAAAAAVRFTRTGRIDTPSGRLSAVSLHASACPCPCQLAAAALGACPCPERQKDAIFLGFGEDVDTDRLESCEQMGVVRPKWSAAEAFVWFLSPRAPSARWGSTAGSRSAPSMSKPGLDARCLPSPAPGPCGCPSARACGSARGAVSPAHSTAPSCRRMLRMPSTSR